MKILRTILLAAGGIGGTCGVALPEETIRIGIARSTSNAAEPMALKKGYFKEFGIKLDWEDIDT